MGIEDNIDSNMHSYFNFMEDDLAFIGITLGIMKAIVIMIMMTR